MEMPLRWYMCLRIDYNLFRSLSARIAFVHRMGQLVETIEKLDKVFQCAPRYWTLCDCIARSYSYGSSYLTEGLREVRALCDNIYVSACLSFPFIIYVSWMTSCACNVLTSWWCGCQGRAEGPKSSHDMLSSNRKYWSQFTSTWSQPAKIGLSIVLASLLLVSRVTDWRYSINW